MEEIKVGEYVRTKRGIGKILEIKTVQPKMYGKHDLAYLIDICPRMYITDNEFINHSKNLIDLIEVGDYVNGYRVLDIMEDIKTGEIHLEMTSDYTNEIIGDCTIYNNDIKSIVTHEQFEAMKYKVEDD